MLVQMKTFNKDQPCPPYKDVVTDAEFTLKARFQGPLNGVEKMMKDGKWESYYVHGAVICNLEICKQNMSVIERNTVVSCYFKIHYTVVQLS